ncbi:MAG: riboflavin kinase/FMN adenylyltransferase [Cycloclasticus pugetii]|jgi:riboflavin kinase/FMN adenylyltransferase|uniref:Riboflavin biosynthesis protein n=1 Tax=Cycloclasticus zancles 78-ME TaxID=1198232 RepID=S5T9G0_9GAMM|nr:MULTISPECIES: bifunctional riboflavin kinase/FAD synthetase [Cycloclasticus]AGS40351.1 Riboflavin kinase / FMN adenylyltransferase [Cycloclasticus zancles 78-ME]MBV1899703.1 bifunctional riboflavin kinase/FAD synthetase [Cycloclasticus sp.]MDF1828613.1 bifunctional riboflavin kinase/FAD synthetase [Cycloclasticus pugetii]
MRLIRYLPDGQAFPNGSVLTIGNFDGVHVGHRMVLSALIEQAKSLGLQAVVMCFEPQPIEYFRAEAAPARVSTARDKIEQLSETGVDALYLVRFNDLLANMSAGQFVEMLVQRLNVQLLIVGDDFCFGKNRQGNFEYLKVAGEKYGFSVQRSHSFKIENERVSSTLVRRALENGRLDKVAVYLNRRFSMSGRVMHGHKRGRELGFPTANIRVKNRKTPLKGVFAVTITLESGVVYKGVANVGTRPSIEEATAVLLEAHLFEFSGDLYGQRVVVAFAKKLREEKKFENLEQLTQQILIDSEQAKTYFNQTLTS